LTSQLTIAITLAAIGVIQAVLAQLLSGLFEPMHKRLMKDLTENEPLHNIKKFFHDEDPSGIRLSKVATISRVADTVTAQCISLLVSALGAAFLAWVAVASHQSPLWLSGAIVIGVVALILLGTILYRAKKDKFQTFGLGLKGGGFSAKKLISPDSAWLYILWQVVAVAFVAAAGVVF
jgi:ABC-type bacteriocin/lantibiotic exporter with double-glycine peptidase domain